MDLAGGSYATSEAPQCEQSVGSKRNCRDLVFMDWLCVDFRERLLDALATSPSSTFIEAKHLAKENIVDILDCISSLSISETERGKETADTPGTSLVNIPTDSPPEYLMIHGDSPAAELFQQLSDAELRCLDLSLSTASTESIAMDKWPNLSPRTLIPCDVALLQSGDLDRSDRINIVGSDEMQWWSPQGGFDEIPIRSSPKTTSNGPHWPGGQNQDQTQVPSTPAVLDLMDLDLLAERGEVCFLRQPFDSPTDQSNPKEGAGLPVSSATPLAAQAQTQSLAAGESCASHPVSNSFPDSSPAIVGGAQVVLAHVTPQIPCNESASSKETLPVAASLCIEGEEGDTEFISSYATGIPSLMGLDCTPAHLPPADQIFAAFSHQLPENKRSVAQLLTSLFYAVGSPDALIQLRHALQFARKTSVIPVVQVQSGLHSDLATTVQALDRLDSITTLSHILRRYYLVRLLAHRNRLEHDHIATKVARRGSKRMLKYDCARLGLIRGSGEGGGGRSADASDQRVNKDRPKNRSKTQALTDLMQKIYPGLTPLPVAEDRQTNDCMYSRKLTQLRNRLSCARNWYTFEHTFPGAILALIPCAGRYSISIDK